MGPGAHPDCFQFRSIGTAPLAYVSTHDNGAIGYMGGIDFYGSTAPVDHVSITGNFMATSLAAAIDCRLPAGSPETNVCSNNRIVPLYDAGGIPGRMTPLPPSGAPLDWTPPGYAKGGFSGNTAVATAP